LKHSIYILSLSFFILSGCGSSKTTEATNETASTSNTHSSNTLNIVSGAKEISLEYFTGAMIGLSQEEFIEKMHTSIDFYDDEVDDETPQEKAQSQCLGDLRDSYAYTQSSDNSYELDVDYIDYTSCMTNPDFLSVTTSIYISNMVAIDNNITLSSESFHTLDSYTTDYTSQRVLYFTNFNVKGEEADIEYLMLSASTAIDDFSKPCVKEFGKLECRIREVMYVSSADETVTYSLNDYVKQVVSSKGLYYDSGSIEFSFNDWKGVMTYSDKNTPPTYIASDGYSFIQGTYLDEPREYVEDTNATYTKTITEDGFNIEFNTKNGLFKKSWFVLLSDSNAEYLGVDDKEIIDSTTLTCKRDNALYTCSFTQGEEFTLNPSPYIYLANWSVDDSVSLKTIRSDILETISLDSVIEGLQE